MSDNLFNSLKLLARSVVRIEIKLAATVALKIAAGVQPFYSYHPCRQQPLKRLADLQREIASLEEPALLLVWSTACHRCKRLRQQVNSTTGPRPSPGLRLIALNVDILSGWSPRAARWNAWTQVRGTTMESASVIYAGPADAFYDGLDLPGAVPYLRLYGPGGVVWWERPAASRGLSEWLAQASGIVASKLGQSSADNRQ